MGAVVSWPDDELLDVEDDILHITKNIKGTELLTVSVGFTEFQVKRGSDRREIRSAQLIELRTRFEAERRSGKDRRQSA